MIAAPDWKRAQRGEGWDASHVVMLSVATGQTINHGDLVSVNANGEAERISADAGASPDLSSTRVFGVAVGRSAVTAADSALYPKIAVATIAKNQLLVLRYMAQDGAPATPTAATIGDEATLRMGKANTEVEGVLGVNTKGTGDTVHGHIIDVVDDKFVLVKLDDDVVVGG